MNIKIKNFPNMSYKGGPAFHTLEKSVEDLIPKSSVKVFTLGKGRDKAWQIEAFRKLQTAAKFILKAVPGAGKSFLTLCLCLDKIARSGYNKKALILVSQTNIAKSFRDPCLHADGIMMNGTRYPPPAMDQDFCEETPAKMNKLRDFLCSSVKELRPVDHDRFDNLIGITTHHNFITTWFGLPGVPGLTAEQKRKAVKDLMLIVDECHHICFDNCHDEMTDIGRAISEILDMKDPSSGIGLVTATYFRNDRKDILPQGHRKEFIKYSLRWDVYYPTLHIKEFNFNFSVYKQDPMEMIVESIKKEPNHHHLIILPHTDKGFRGETTLARYLTELSKVIPENKLLDMVTPYTQIKNFDKLNKSPDKYHVVVACDLFNEGTDWPPCDRIHNAAYSSDPSLPRLGQIDGRAFREFPTKDSIIITNYIRVKLNDDLRGLLSDHFNALMVSLMIDELFNPIVLPTLPRVSWSEKGIPLSEILDERYDGFREELTLKCELLGKGLQNPSKVRNMCRAIAERFWDPSYSDEFGVSLDCFISATCLLALRTKFIRNNGGISSVNTDAIPMDLSIIRKDFDKIWERTIGGDMIFGTTEPLSEDVFREVRRIVSRRLASGSWEADKDSADGYDMLEAILKAPDNSLLPGIPHFINMVGTEVVTPQGRGRVLTQDGNSCVVRIYKDAQDGFQKRVIIKKGGVLYIYRSDVSAWIRKNFLNIDASCLPGRVRRGLITDAQLIGAKKAFDATVNISVCKPIS